MALSQIAHDAFPMGLTVQPPLVSEVDEAEGVVSVPRSATPFWPRIMKPIGVQAPFVSSQPRPGPQSASVAHMPGLAAQ